MMSLFYLSVLFLFFENKLFDTDAGVTPGVPGGQARAEGALGNWRQE